MRVLAVIFEQLIPLSGGGTPRISNVIKSFVRHGHRVYVASSIGVKKEEALEHLGCIDILPLTKVSRLDTHKMRRYTYAHSLNLLRVINYGIRIAPDIIVSHNSIAGMAANLVRYFRGNCLAVLDLTDLLFEYLADYDTAGWMRQVGRVGRHLERKTILQSSRIITISRAMERIILNYGVEKEKIDIVCDGVDTAIFKALKYGGLRQRIDAKARNIVIFQGVIDPQDHPEILIGAAKIVLKKHPDTTFLIVGDGTALPRLKEKAEQTGLLDNFYFSGWIRQEQVPECISASDIGLVILPNSLSARGRVTLKEFEYWACGIPVIVPHLPALEEVVEEGRTGLFYEPDNSKDLARKTCLMIENKALREKMGREGMKEVKEKFEWSRLADRFVEKCEKYKEEAIKR